MEVFRQNWAQDDIFQVLRKIDDKSFFDFLHVTET